jgi:hypothetical protein
MKLPDVNVLIGAVNSASPEHECARTWLETAFGAPAGVGLAWVALLGFVRLSTRRGILPKPLSVENALLTYTNGSPRHVPGFCTQQISMNQFWRAC